MDGDRLLACSETVRLFEYRCPAHKGDRPRPEVQGWPSICVVRHGTFSYREGLQTRVLAKGFLLLGNPGREYTVSHEHCGGDVCLVFDFEPRAFSRLLDELFRRAPRTPFVQPVLPPIPRVHAMVLETLEMLAAGPTPLGLDELGHELAALVLERSSGREAEPASARASIRLRRTIHESLEFLDHSSTAAVRLADAARAAGLSPFHFLRIFKRECGVTPHQFVLHTRVRRAMELLLESELPVTEVAFAVGFGDLSNFNHAFRREVGCAPTAFRARARRYRTIAS